MEPEKIDINELTLEILSENSWILEPRGWQQVKFRTWFRPQHRRVFVLRLWGEEKPLETGLWFYVDAVHPVKEPFNKNTIECYLLNARLSLDQILIDPEMRAEFIRRGRKHWGLKT